MARARARVNPIYEQENDILARRMRARQKNMEKEREEVFVKAENHAEESEYETETDSESEEEDEEETPGHLLIKPVFVPRQHRETIEEQEARIREEEAQLQIQQLKKENRKH